MAAGASVTAYSGKIEEAIVRTRIRYTIRQNESCQRIHFEQVKEKTGADKQYL